MKEQKIGPQLYSLKLYQYFKDLHASYQDNHPKIADRGYFLLYTCILASYSMIYVISIWVCFKYDLDNALFTLVFIILSIFSIVSIRELVRLNRLLKESLALTSIWTEWNEDQPYIGKLENLQATVNANYQIDHKFIINIPRYSILNLTRSSSGCVLQFYLTLVSREYKSLILSNISDDEKAFSRIDDANFRREYEALSELQIVDLINAELKIGKIDYQDIESLNGIENEVNDET